MTIFLVPKLYLGTHLSAKLRFVGLCGEGSPLIHPAKYNFVVQVHSQVQLGNEERKIQSDTPHAGGLTRGRFSATFIKVFTSVRALPVSESVDDTLQTEMAAYWRQLPTFHQHEGEYIVMQGETPLGFYANLTTALDAGYDKYGFGPFLVKRVVTDELLDPVWAEDDFHAERPAFEQHTS